MTDRDDMRGAAETTLRNMPRPAGPATHDGVLALFATWVVELLDELEAKEQDAHWWRLRASRRVR